MFCSHGVNECVKDQVSRLERTFRRAEIMNPPLSWPSFRRHAYQNKIRERGLGKARAEEKRLHQAHSAEQSQGKDCGEEGRAQVSESRGQYERSEEAEGFPDEQTAHVEERRTGQVIE